MRDENNEITDGFEVLISDMKESKIGCTRCKVDVNGKCRAPIPVVAYRNVGHAPITAVCAVLVWESSQTGLKRESKEKCTEV